MDPQLLSYYEAIERASAEMLAAARAGNWDEVVKLEGACVLLISKLKHAAQGPEAAVAHGGQATQGVNGPIGTNGANGANGTSGPRGPHGSPAATSGATRPQALEAARAKSRIMQRILVNDAEIRHLAEPWLQDIDDTLAGRCAKTLH